MSLPQPHQSPTLEPSDSPQEDDPSRPSNLVRYDSIQGALGGRRVSQPVPLAYLRSSSNIPPSQAHMPPDSRYSYPPSSSSAPQHQYPYEQHYPPSPPSYETPVYSHNALPRMRTPHSLSEPSRTPVSQPPQGYGLSSYVPYPPGQYAVPSGMPTASWGPPYAQLPHTPTDASISPELVRVEPGTQPPSHAPGPYRTSNAPFSHHVDVARHFAGSSRDGGAPPDPKGKQREAPPPIHHRSRISQEPDYHKLSQTYRVILDNASHSPALGSLPAAQPSGLPSDVLSRIYECALEGVRQFDSSDQTELPPRSPSPHLRPQPSKEDLSGKGPQKRQRIDPSTADLQKCMGCGATSTPEWRRGPLGPRTLCNACGLVYAKLIKKRGRDAAAKSIMEGVAAFAAAGTVPGEFVQDYGGIATGGGGGSMGAHHAPQPPPDEDDREGPPRVGSSAEGEGSEDDSYEERPSRSGRGRRQEDRY